MSSLLLPDLVTRAAERWPDHPAIVMDGRTLTYAELETASNQVARTLARYRVGHNDRVALYLPKSPEAVAALYGIMKVGAAYVSVDPAAPPARLAYIARDCAVAGLVTASSRAAALAQEFAADGAPPLKVVLYGEGEAATDQLAGVPTESWQAITAENGTPLANPASDTDLAYILYTSGSTGQPKGVMIPHQSSLSFVAWAGDTFGITHDDRLANHAGFHFDLSTFDLFSGARAGATVYPVSPRIASFPAALVRQWSQDRLTVWYATPSTLTLMLVRGNLAGADLSSLRLLLFAGEVFATKHLRQLMALAPQARFANLYGPTETNVCTWYDVTAPPAGDTPLPIGLVCPNCTGFILDERGGQVSKGEVGELWIGGGTLMRGYWGRPELTGERLREVTPVAGTTVLAYNTGDLVRALPDGNLQYNGRRDHQVKTRGYRVELGEIETVLNGHPAVAEAVVLAVPDDELGHLLRGVAVAKPGATLEETELKRHCAKTLPHYMVPEGFEIRSSMPRTASDKIDRDGLLRATIATLIDTQRK